MAAIWSACDEVEGDRTMQTDVGSAAIESGGEARALFVTGFAIVCGKGSLCASDCVNADEGRDRGGQEIVCQVILTVCVASMNVFVVNRSVYEE